MTEETDKISRIFDQMFGLVQHIRPENRSCVRQYLDSIWKNVHALVRGLSRRGNERSVQQNFDTYEEEQESRNRKSLADLEYELGDLDTVKSIISPKCYEKVRKCLE